MKKQRTCLLVLGMHRSGTSAITRIFNLLGAELPLELLGPGDGGNTTGHWESKRLIKFNDRLLSELGAYWYDWKPLDLTKLTSERKKELQLELANIISAEFGAHDFIVMKDPRFCLFPEFIAETLTTIGYKVLPIVPFRNPLEVANSLKKRENFPVGHICLLWLRHVLNAELYCRNSDYVSANFENTWTDWKEIIKKVESTFDIKFPISQKDASKLVVSYISPELHRNKNSLEELFFHPLTRQWITDVFQSLVILSENPTSSQARKKIDQVRQEFDSSSLIFSHVLSEQRSQETEHIQTQLAEKTDLVGNLQNQISNTSQQMSVLEKEAEQYQSQVETLHTELKDSKRITKNLNQQIRRRDKQIQSVKTELEKALGTNERRIGIIRKHENQILKFRDTLGMKIGDNREILEVLNQHLNQENTLQKEISQHEKEVNHLKDSLAKQKNISLQWEQLSENNAKLIEELRSEVEQKSLYIENIVNNYKNIISENNENAGEKLSELSVEIENIKQEFLESNSWRLTKPIRVTSNISKLFKNKIMTSLQFFRVIPRVTEANGGVRKLNAKIVANYKQGGTKAVLSKTANAIDRHSANIKTDNVTGNLQLNPISERKIEARDLNSAQPMQPDNRYQAWLRVNKLSERAATKLKKKINAHSNDLPLLSILMPVYNPDLDLLDKAIESVISQINFKWELCIVDDASTLYETRLAIRKWANKDSRIKFKFLAQNGNISHATNVAASISTGDYLVFLDQDDILTQDALALIALKILNEPKVDYLYSDDDKIDINDTNYGPQFKPGWSPILLLSFMYMSHIKVVRRTLFEKLGGFRIGFEGSQDYDFALRVADETNNIDRIPKILYHWRAIPGSTADSGAAKPDSFEAGRKAVQEAFDRKKITANIIHPKWASSAKIGVFQPIFSDDGPGVTIVIPTKNGLDLIKPCLESLEKTSYRNYNVLIIDNESDDPETILYLSTLKHEVVKIPNQPKASFSYAYINNKAVERVNTEYVLFLNNDTKILNKEWLSQMMGYAQIESVGAVGARLLFDDNTINHAGIVHGYYGGMAGPAFRNLPHWNHGKMGLARVTRECSAVTAACMLTRTSLFVETGGFDEQNFAVAYNDVDYCYRLVDNGLTCIYCSDAELIHFEGKTRGFNDNPREITAFRRKYSGRKDPWYNPNLSLETEHFDVHPYHLPLEETPIKIVMFSHNLNLEGAPNSMLEMIVGLKSSGFIDPLVVSPSDGPLRSVYEAHGIPTRIITNPLTDVHDIEALKSSNQEIIDIINEYNAQAIYANTLQTFWAILAAKQASIPSVWNVRESEPWETYFDWLSPSLKTAAYECFGFPYRVIFVANSTRLGWSPVETTYNFTVIHNGLKLDLLEERTGNLTRDSAREKLKFDSDRVALVIVGTICDRKGQMDIIDAIQYLPTSLLDEISIYIVGDRDSAYSKQLHDKIDQFDNGISDHIHVIPETPDAVKYYVAADIALCCSRIESYPRIVIEAMALGLPLVTTPVFGIREQVREDHNALFYEPGNAAALAHAVTRLITDREMRETFSKNSRIVFDSLTTYDEMLNGYGSIFSQAVFSNS